MAMSEKQPRQTNTRPVYLAYGHKATDNTKKQEMIQLDRSKVFNFDGNRKLFYIKGYYPQANMKRAYYFAKEKSFRAPFNRYIQLAPVYYYGETSSRNPWDYDYVNALNKLHTPDATSIYTVFRVTKIADTFEEIKSNSWLKKYTNVLHNNDYFSAIPQLNELWHWDNYIDILSSYRINVQFDKNTQVKLYNEREDGGIRDVPLNSVPEFVSDDWEHFDYTGYYYKTWDNFKLLPEIIQAADIFTKEAARGHVEL